MVMLFMRPVALLLTVSSAFGVLSLMSCSAGLPAKNAAMKTSFHRGEEVIYTPKDWPQALPGDLFLPDTKQPAPGVLLIHGGGWTGGDKRSQMRSLAKRLAKRGFVVLNATYRTTPEWQHPAQYEDLLQALRWMRANAKALNLDANRLATFGYSAGGHLAALVGLQAGSEGIPIRAIVAGGAPTNLNLTESRLVEMLLGGNRSEKPLAHREASPITHVTPESPPVFLYHASWDRIVWPIHARMMREKLMEKGVEHQFVHTAGPGHISGFLFPGKAIGSALTFLDRHLHSAP